MTTLALATLAFVLAAAGQAAEKPKPVAPGEAQKQAAETKAPQFAQPPALEELDQLRLKSKVQALEGALKDLTLLETQSRLLQAQYTDLIKQRDDLQAELNRFMALLFADRKLDRGEWTIDMKTLQFVRVEKKPDERAARKPQ